MPRRLGLLNLLFAAAALVCWPNAASAHRLIVEYRVLPDHQVQVEGWYSSPANPHPASQAKVTVTRADGSRLVDGELDANGIFKFSYDRPEDLSVAVSHTGGHYREVVIPAAELDPQKPAESGAPASPTPSSRRASSFHEWAQEIMVEVGFVLALAAFVLSVWNARRLRELRRERETKTGKPGP
jgi:hypothetical protein